MKLKNVNTTNNGLDQKAFNMEWCSKDLEPMTIGKAQSFQTSTFWK